jgi:predicted dehydrogenase
MPKQLIKRAIRKLLGRAQDSLAARGESRALRQLRLKVDAGLASPPRRVAIIGCGKMGRHIARATKLIPGWSVTALCDSREDATAALAAAEAAEAAIHPTSEALFASRGSFDILAIATTAPGHVPIALAAMRAGVRSILVEKPVAVSLAEARMLSDEAVRTGCRVAVDHTRRWAVPGDGIARIIATGAIGRVVSIHVTPGSGGFAMIGTHFFDLLRWILRSNPIKVRADFDAEQQASHRGVQFEDKSGRCELIFQDGVRASVDLAEAHARPHGHLVIYGSSGRIEIDEKNGVARLHGASGVAHSIDYPWNGGQATGVAAALVNLAGTGPIACSIEDGAAALEVAIAANLSARGQGEWVDLPLSAAACEERFRFP